MSPTSPLTPILPEQHSLLTIGERCGQGNSTRHTLRYRRRRTRKSSETERGFRCTSASHSSLRTDLHQMAHRATPIPRSARHSRGSDPPRHDPSFGPASFLRSKIKWLGDFRSTVCNEVKAMVVDAWAFESSVTPKRSFGRLGYGERDKAKPRSASSETRQS